LELSWHGDYKGWAWFKKNNGVVFIFESRRSIDCFFQTSMGCWSNDWLDRKLIDRLINCWLNYSLSE
jgi:hypothetical protein